MDFVEAGRAPGELALLQQLHVTLVQAVQGPPAHSPVEVVHALTLQSDTGSASLAGNSSCTNHRSLDQSQLKKYFYVKNGIQT